MELPSRILIVDLDDLRKTRSGRVFPLDCEDQEWRKGVMETLYTSMRNRSVYIASFEHRPDIHYVTEAHWAMVTGAWNAINNNLFSFVSYCEHTPETCDCWNTGTPVAWNLLVPAEVGMQPKPEIVILGSRKRTYYRAQQANLPFVDLGLWISLR